MLASTTGACSSGPWGAGRWATARFKPRSNSRIYKVRQKMEGAPRKRPRLSEDAGQPVAAGWSVSLDAPAPNPIAHELAEALSTSVPLTGGLRGAPFALLLLLCWWRGPTSPC